MSKGQIIYLQKFGKTLTSGKKLLSGGIHIGTELGEGSDFTVLGQIQLHGTRNLFHGLHLGGGTDTGDGKTDVDGWTDTLICIIVTITNNFIRNLTFKKSSFSKKI